MLGFPFSRETITRRILRSHLWIISYFCPDDDIAPTVSTRDLRIKVTHDSWPLFSSNRGRKEPDYPSTTRKWIISVNRIPRPRTDRDTLDGNWVICMTVDRSSFKKIIQPIPFSRRWTSSRPSWQPPLSFSHVTMFQLIDGNLWICIHEGRGNERFLRVQNNR